LEAYRPQLPCQLSEKNVFILFGLLSCLEPFASHIADGFQIFGFFVGDPLNYAFVKLSIIKNALEQGVFPLWSPAEGLGMPLFASGALPVLESLLLLPHIDVFDFTRFLCAAYTFLGLVFFYNFARRLGANQFGAIVGSIFATINSYTLMYHNDIVILAATALQNALMLILIDASRRNNLIVHGVLGSLVVGLNATYCRPNDIVWVLATALCYSMFCETYRNKNCANTFFRRVGVLWGIIILLGLMNSALVTTPFIDSLLNSIRLKQAIAATQYRVHGWDILNPLTSSYVNVPLPILLGAIAAVLGLLKTDSRRTVLYFLFQAVVLVCLLLPTGLYELVRHLPLFSNYAEPIRIIPSLTFAIATLAAMGFTKLEQVALPDALLRWIDKSKRSTSFHLAAVAVIAIALTLQLTTSGAAWSIFCVILAVASVVYIIFNAITSTARISLYLAPLVVLASILSVSFADGSTLRRASFSKYLEEKARNEQATSFLNMRLRSDFFRVLSTMPEQHGRDFAAYGLPNIVYYSIVPGKYFVDFYKQALGVDANVTTEYFSTIGSALFPLGNIRYLVDSGRPGNHAAFEALPMDKYPVVFSNAANGVTIREMPDAMPRVFMTCGYSVAKREDHLQELKEFVQSGGNLRDRVMLDANPPYAPCAGDLNYTVTINSYSFNSVSLTIETSKPSTLVLLDYNDGGWRAFVDGIKQPVIIANSIFRAVNVNTGKHTVVFEYDPISFLVGRWLTSVGLLVCAVLLTCEAVRMSCFRSRC
jgi:hypothetical protein